MGMLSSSENGFYANKLNVDEFGEYNAHGHHS